MVGHIVVLFLSFCLMFLLLMCYRCVAVVVDICLLFHFFLLLLCFLFFYLMFFCCSTMFYLRFVFVCFGIHCRYAKTGGQEQHPWGYTGTHSVILFLVRFYYLFDDMF